MKRSLLLGFALLVAACATPEASKEEKDAASSQYVACLAKTAPTYDDGRSDASTIGLAVYNSCRREFQAWLDVSAKGMSPGARQMFYERMEKRGPEAATQVVLKRRAALRQQQ